MAPISDQVFATYFNKVLFGGSVSPGIEVAADLGLSADKFILIPTDLAISTYWKLRPRDGDKVKSLLEEEPNIEEAETSRTLIKNPDRVYIREKKFFVIQQRQQETFLEEVWPVYASSPSVLSVRKFIRANSSRITQSDPQDRRYGMALRYYSVIYGLVASVYDKEYEEDTGSRDAPVSDEDAILEYLLNEQTATQAITLICARFLSWRRTNHATGGSPASGVVQRTGAAFGWYTPDPSGGNNSLKRFTELFHSNAHQANCKTISALFFGGHSEHWGVFNPKFGFSFPTDVQTSLKVRAENRSGVAGCAAITDAIVVMRSLVMDQSIVCAINFDKCGILVNKYKEIVKYGVLCGVGANWWVEHNPFGLSAHPVLLDDPELQALVGDLATANAMYLSSKTLKAAKALETAMDRYGEVTRKDFWRSLAKYKRATSSRDVLTALEVMRRQVGIIGVNVVELVSQDIHTRTEATNRISDAMAHLALELDIPAARRLTVPSSEEVASALKDVVARTGAREGTVTTTRRAEPMEM